MPTILGANSVSGAYEISNSLRFRTPDSPRLTRAQANGNQDKWTWSGWVKRSGLGAAQCFFATTDGSATSFDAKFDANDDLDVYNYLGGGFGARLITDRKFRDVSAWYHIVIVYDSGNGTEAHRLRIYVNGTEETSFSTTNYPSQNEDSDLNVSGSNIEIGRQSNGSQFFDGYMAEVHLLDGQAYDPTYFGETNDNGVWVPIKYTSGNYGTNGFFMEFQQTGTSANASGMGADTSGNDNHFAITNIDARDICVDTPTNNFNTLNFNANAMGGTLSEGNTKCAGAAAVDKNVYGTFGLTQGKWYWEVKVTSQGARGSVWVTDGDHSVYAGTNYAGHSFWSGGSSTSGTANSNVGSGASNNDIICFALDLDNGKLDIAKNGDIDTSGTAQITGLATTGLDRDYRIGQAESGNPASTMQHNYGNPPFAISSGNADANGYGNFEYAVPSGYYSLCTKNLAEFG